MQSAIVVRRLFIAGMMFAAAAFAAAPAFAQSAAQWPDRPVRLLVTVGAGGGSYAYLDARGELRTTVGILRFEQHSLKNPQLAVETIDTSLHLPSVDFRQQ